MNATQEQLESLKNNLGRLLRQLTAVKNENNILKNQIDAQRKMLSEKMRSITALEEEVSVVKAMKSVPAAEDGSGGEKNGMKDKINELIREVDKCIAMLNT